MNGKFWFYFAFVFVVGLVAVGCGGGGGGGSANPVAAPLSTGSLANLTGVVSLDNQPLANAKVFLYPSSSAYMAGISQLSSVKANVIAQTLHNDGSYSTFSDAQGRYNFVSVPVGNYTLIAMKDQNHQFARTNVVLGAVTQVDAQLTPTGSVIGQIQIVNSENVTENVSGAIVYLDGTSYVAVSAIDGRFTIANVPANQSFTLKVISSRGVPTTAPSVTITPGLPSNAGTLLLSAPTVPTSTISGSVSISGVAAPDAKLANHMILLTAANQPPLINLTDQSGQFAFIVRTGGAYRLTPIPEEYDSIPLYQDVNVVIGQNLAVSQVFALQAEPEQETYIVQGSLTKSEKAFNEADEGGVPITLTESTSGRTYAAVSIPDGSFNFAVPAGEYELAIGGGYALVAPLTPNPFTVSAPYTLPDLSIRPTLADALLVKGQINKVRKAFNEADAGGVPLTLTDFAGITYPAVSDADGYFSFYVPAGEYYISVGGGYAFQTHPFSGSSFVVSVNYNFSAIINLVPTQQQLFSVHGTLSKTAKAFGEADNGGVPITFSEINTGLNYATVSAPDGSFNFQVPAGEYKLAVGGGYEFVVSESSLTINSLTAFTTKSIRPTNNTLMVQGTVSKRSKSFNESDEGGVALTLKNTDATGKTYPAVTSADGSFAFYVPAGEYQLSVGGAYAFETHPLGGSPLNLSANYYFASTIYLVSTQNVLMQVQGNISKEAYAFDESDQAGVNLTLTDTGTTGNIFSAISDVNGYFSFEVPSGTYKLNVGGSYKLKTSPHPDVVTNDPVTSVSPTIVVVPSRARLVKIQGSVVKNPSETDNAGVNLTLTDQAATGMVYSAITDASGNYSFEIPSGTYQLQVVGAYKTLTAIPQVVTNAADGYNPVAQVTVNPTKKAMVKVLGQIAKVPVETDNAGVNLTLTDTSVATAVFSAVSDADGRFAFDVPSGTYKLNVGGNYKLQTTPYPDIVTNAEENGLGAAINVVPTQVLYTVTGSITKSSLLPGDTTTGPVRLILRSASVSYTAVTASGGNFTFRVVAGTYDLLIDGDYDFDSALSPVAISADYGFGSQSVSPKSGRPAEISGQITGAPANLSEPFEVRLWDQENEKFVAQTFSVNDGSANAYSFKSLESGTYRVIAFPHKNGYFAETPVGSPIILADGEVLSGHNISAALESPEITSINFPDSSTIELVGNRFASSTPDVAATKVFIGGNLAARPLSSDLATTSDKARINTLAPGTYTVELRYSWPYELAVGKVQTFVLKSNVFEFLKPIQPPTNLNFNEVTDTKIRVSWKNAPWTQNSEVEIWQGATQIGTTATVDGTSHEFTGLSAATGYEVRIRNRAGNIVSTNLTGTATTKTTVSQQIQNVNIPIDYILSAGSAYDFVPGNDQLFILHSESVTTLISKFASDGSGIASFSLVSPTVTREGASLAFANNLLYLCYLDTNSFIKVESFDPATLNPVGTHTAIAGNYSEAQMIAADNKLFIACTRYSGNDHELYYLPNPTGITLGSSQRIAYRSSTGLTNDSSDSYLAMVCADATAGSLYFVAPDPDGTSNYVVDKFPLSNPDTASSTLAKIPSEYAGYGISVKQFKAANDKVFLRTYADKSDYQLNYVYMVDRFGGYYEYSGNTSIFERRGEYHVDHKGRLWMAEISSTGRKFFVNLGADGSIIRSLVAPDFISTDSSDSNAVVFPQPANFIKEDPVTKATYMLYQRDNYGLAFFRYSSDF